MENHNVIWERTFQQIDLIISQETCEMFKAAKEYQVTKPKSKHIQRIRQNETIIGFVLCKHSTVDNIWCFSVFIPSSYLKKKKQHTWTLNTNTHQICVHWILHLGYRSNPHFWPNPNHFGFELKTVLNNLCRENTDFCM